MASALNAISSALGNEFWELNLTPQVCGTFLSQLDYCKVRLLSPAISCSFQIDEPKAITENEFLCLPGAGLNIDFRETANAFLLEAPLSESPIELVLTSRDRNEQLVIEIPQAEKNTLRLLTKELVKTHDVLPKSAILTDAKRHLCSCCKKRREETKSRISSHPLYHIISFACFLKQEVCLDFHGFMTSCSRTFLPARECHPEGIISLASLDSVIVVDLGEVFQSIGRLADFEGEKSTIFQCYNSHGKLLLSLTQQNRKLFEAWDHINHDAEDE